MGSFIDDNRVRLTVIFDRDIQLCRWGPFSEVIFFIRTHIGNIYAHI